MQPRTMARWPSAMAIGWCLALAVSLPVVPSEAATQCASLNHTLTLCPMECKQNELCFQSGDSCPYRCVKNGLGAEHVEVHFRHGSYRSAQERERLDTDHEILQMRFTMDSELIDSPSNDDVDAIDALAFSSAITEVWFVGGTHFQSRGVVVNITLAPQLLTKTNVSFVVFKGINLGETKPRLTDILPPGVEELELPNCLLEDVPLNLTQFKKLQSLKIDTNYLREFPKSLALPNLTILNAASNQLSTFDAHFPALRELDLSYNNFSTIPPSIFGMSHLVRLNLSRNPLNKFWLTKTQYEFLAERNVSMNSDVGDTSCDPSLIRNLTTIDNVVIPFCIGTRPIPPSPTAIAIWSLAAALVIAALAVVVISKRRRRKPNTKEPLTRPTASSTATTASTDTAYDMEEETAALFLDDKKLLAMRIDLAELQDVKRIGIGGFGEVWLVSYRETLLASKRLIARANADVLVKFISEIKLNASLSHSRIVRFEGAAWTTISNLQALFEYMPGGDLRTWLMNPTNSTGWSAQKMMMTMDIVEALVYVHSFSPPLVHRDLKSRNVLLSESLRAKLCDFGIARFQSSQETMTQAMGTCLWLAPEVIACRRDYDHFADIWAFGVVLSELDTHKLPYEDVKGPNGNRMPEIGVMHQVGMDKLRPTFRPSCPPAIQALAERCLAFDPTQRPTAIAVAQTLEEIYSSKAYQHP